MIIKDYPLHFSLEIERQDWLSATTYILLELLKSIPSNCRSYNPTTKIWLVNQDYKHILSRIQVFTEEEESDGLKGITELMSLFD